MSSNIKASKVSKPRPYVNRAPQGAISKVNDISHSSNRRYAKYGLKHQVEHREEDYNPNFEGDCHISQKYNSSKLYKSSIKASKNKNIASSLSKMKKSKNESKDLTDTSKSSNNSSNNSKNRKPSFYHPQMKIHNPECPTMEPDSEDEDLFIQSKKKITSVENFSCESNFSGYSLLAKPSGNNMKGGKTSDISTFDSIHNIALKHLSVSDQQLEEEFTENEEEEPVNYKNMPEYEKIRHFEEEDVTDDEFMDIVIDRLSHVDGDITYKMFRDQLLPTYRKPSFRDYTRFRRLEKIMLAK